MQCGLDEAKKLNFSLDTGLAAIGLRFAVRNELINATRKYGGEIFALLAFSASQTDESQTATGTSTQVSEQDYYAGGSEQSVGEFPSLLNIPLVYSSS